jgi:3-methyl-2-oxobutanoate hydroxymethyltransferase
MLLSRRINALDIMAKKNHQKLVWLTAYTHPIAKIIDNFCDVILVGDSLSMAIYGHKDTLATSLEMIIEHTKTVMMATKKSLIAADLPFGTYEESPAQAFKTAAKIIKETGCEAVKIETSPAMIPTIEFLTARGIAVIAHVGLLSQHVRKIGGYKYQGRDEDAAKEILQTAILAAKAGAFAIVIEGVIEKLASEITKQVAVPTIGIGAGANCDGQILVIDDLLGLNQEFKPKFAKTYCNLAKQINDAAEAYASEVRLGTFPAKENITN